MPAKTTKQSPAAPNQNHVPAKETATRAARRLRLPPPKLFRFKRVTHPVKLPGAWYVARQAACLLWRQRRLFLGILVVYAVLSVIFVRGFDSGTNTATLRQQLGQGFSGNTSQLAAGFSSIATLLASSGTEASTSVGAYQILLWVVMSLATIWALRQISAGERVGLRDAFYKGMYPLIPFMLIFVLILIQTVPFLVGGGLYSVVTEYGIAITVIEKLLWGLLFLALAVISGYMLCSSLFALYITTLPDMTPMRALRSARQLVCYRRWAVVRKLLFLPLILIVPSFIIALAFIWFVPPAAPWVIFILAMICLIAAHAYMYTFYRELLKA